MSDFGGSGLDPNLRSTVSNDFSVPGDAKVEGLNNQLNGLFAQRQSKTESLAMKFETLANIAADIQSILSEIQAKQGELSEEMRKDEPNESRIQSLQNQIQTLRGRIDQLRNKQDSVNREIGRLRNEIRTLDGQINAKKTEISGAERERDTQRDTKRSQNDAQLRQIQEAEDRISRAAQSNAEIGKQVEVKLQQKDKVIEAVREQVELVETDIAKVGENTARLSQDQMRVAWQDASFDSLSTGQAIQLMAWSLSTMPDLRQATDNKFVGTSPRNDGLLAP